MNLSYGVSSLKSDPVRAFSWVRAYPALLQSYWCKVGPWPAEYQKGVESPALVLQWEKAHLGKGIEIKEFIIVLSISPWHRESCSWGPTTFHRISPLPPLSPLIIPNLFIFATFQGAPLPFPREMDSYMVLWESALGYTRSTSFAFQPMPVDSPIGVVIYCIPDHDRRHTWDPYITSILAWI